MQIQQCDITLGAKPRGFHLVTDEIIKQVPFLSQAKAGQLNLFIQHSSASLSINENADPSVRSDMEAFFTELCDHKPYYQHTYEGDDDMPAHIKSSVIGASLNIPVTQGRLNLGTWQGIYLNEHRDHGGARRIVATLMFSDD